MESAQCAKRALKVPEYDLKTRIHTQNKYVKTFVDTVHVIEQWEYHMICTYAELPSQLTTEELIESERVKN